MRQAMLVHLIAIALVFGATAYILWTLGPALPFWAWAIELFLAGSYFVIWTGLLGIRLAALARGRDAPARWGRHDLAILWYGDVVTVLAFWLMMPYADEALRLTVVIVLYSSITVQVFGSIRRPPDRPGSPALPVVLPIAIGLYYLAHWERDSLVLAPLSLAHAWLVHVLRAVLQAAVDSAIAARGTAEAALAQAAAERDAKTRFLASASHDLGQPLQAARLFFDQAMRSPAPASRHRAAEKASWALDGAEQLLAQMLDHLRLDSGSVQPRLTPLAIGPLIARVAELNEPAARLADVGLSVLPSRLQVQADAALVERILGNLLANAIRHASARRVLMGARRREGRVRVWVIDDGSGIAESDIPRLFEDFVQGSDHGDRIRGGFGLGLASARRMAGLMGAEVGLERKWRRGSAFWLELPA
jgi:signal transduction histidine kinase